MRYLDISPSSGHNKVPISGSLLSQGQNIGEKGAMQAATAGRSEMNIEVSIAVAIGDHNFPDLVDFVAEDNDHNEPHPRTRQHISLRDLLNPDDASHESDNRDAKTQGRRL